jgi:hypothetical protein
MTIMEIVKDSLRYPFSDWKKILILGIFLVFNSIAGEKDIVSLLGITNATVLWFFLIIGPIIGFVVYGYLFRIVKSSVIDIEELPEFNEWFGMFKDGIKIFIISFVYASPAILILVLAVLFNPSILSKIALTPLSFEQILLMQTGIVGSIASLYLIIIFPIGLMAIAYMAYNNSKLRAAFRFSEILKKIKNIGWANLIEWYLVIGFILLILTTIAVVISFIFFPIIHILDIVIELTLIPYISMYFVRSLALFYKSE